MKKREGNLKWLGGVLLVLWLVFLCGSTVYTLDRRNKTMPVVDLIQPGTGTLSYTEELEAVTESERQAVLRVSIYSGIPQKLLEKGRDLGIGVISSCEFSGEDFLVTVELKEAHRAGETLTAVLSCTPEDTFSQVVDGRALHPGAEYGEPCVFEVEEVQGAWGTEYRLKEKSVSCFPWYYSQNQVSIQTELDGPIAVGEPDIVLEEGTAVKIAG